MSSAPTLKCWSSHLARWLRIEETICIGLDPSIWARENGSFLSSSSVLFNSILILLKIHFGAMDSSTMALSWQKFRSNTCTCTNLGLNLAEPGKTKLSSGLAIKEAQHMRGPRSFKLSFKAKAQLRLECRWLVPSLWLTDVVANKTAKNSFQVAVGNISIGRIQSFLKIVDSLEKKTTASLPLSTTRWPIL